MNRISCRLFDLRVNSADERLLADVAARLRGPSSDELRSYEGVTGVVYGVPAAICTEAQSVGAGFGVAFWLLSSESSTDLVFAGTRGALRELCDLCLTHSTLAALAQAIRQAMNRPAVHPLTLGQRIVELDRTYLMGIVNCTPDSFSDGGQLTDSDAAIRHAEQLVADGAEILDVGGESTRPGAAEVPAEIELRRVLPVVNALARAGHMVSIDTRKPIVARRAVDAGAVMINDVGGLREREMIDLAATTKVAVIVMHMRGNPADMQQYASYTDVVAEVADFLLTQVSRAVAHGVRREQLLLDPGIGFAKTLDHNLSLLKHLRELTSLGHAVVVGTSRKAFIGTLTDRPVDDREFGTAATLAMAVDRGAQILRVHNVRRAREVVNVSEAVRNAAFC